MLRKKKYRKSLLILTCLLVIIGLLALISASSIKGAEEYHDVFYYVKKQLLQGVLGGFFLMWLISVINYKIWQKFALILFILNIILVGLCFVSPFKYVINSSHRWFKLGPLVFQPSEFLKITYILFLAQILSKASPQKLQRIFGAPFLTFLFSLGSVGLLLGLQPSTGTFLILACSATAMYLAAGLTLKQFVVLIMSASLLLGGLIIHSDYRLARIKGFFDTEEDPLGKGYQSRQALIGIGSGGLFGVGFGNSVQKFNYLPASHTDAIFAIIAEETGLVGSFCLLVIYLLLISLGFGLAKEIPNLFGKYVTIGLITGIGSQAFINIAAMCKLMPITGIPLPFISYGSSALITNLAEIGFLLNFSKNST